MFSVRAQENVQSKIGFVMRLEKSGFCLSSGFYMQAATFTHYLQNHSAPFFFASLLYYKA